MIGKGILQGALIALAFLAAAAPAKATLVGDEIQFTRFNSNGDIVTGPDTAIVGEGPEFSFSTNIFYDVSASRIDFILTETANPNGLIFGSSMLVFSDLDWIGQPGVIVGIELTTVPAFDATASFTADSVTLNVGGGQVQTSTYASIELITRHAQVSEPGSLALFTAGIGFLGLARRRMSRRNERRLAGHGPASA